MTSDQIDKLIKHYTKVTLEECEEDRLDRMGNIDGDELEAIWGVVHDKLEENNVHLLNNNFSKVTDTANKIIEEHSLSVPRESKVFKQLCRELLKANQHILRTELKRWDGNYSDQFEGTGVTLEDTSIKTELLSKVIKAHVNEHKTVWEPRGVKQAQSSLEKFLEFVGDKPIGTVEKEHASPDIS